MIRALNSADPMMVADRDIQDDLRLLTAYRAALNQPTAADSLRYAGFLKLFGAPQ
jgi:hypothetical protein